MRVLVIAARSDFHLLVKKHVEIEWPEANITEHRLGKDPMPPPNFAACGYDAVVVASADLNQAERLAKDFALRVEFAPVILLLLREPPAPLPPKIPGVLRLYGAKLVRAELIDALKRASIEQRQKLSQLRRRPDFEDRYRFGSISIRGHRCLNELGTGGMCKVYLAESERAGSVVVLKVFSQVPDVSERIISFDRFIQEYEIVASLKHDNIVRIFDLGIADDHAYIAMEHFPAGDLRQRMKAPIAAADAVSYVRQIASALQAIHTVGILHRDLKPANIMLRTDGTLCLIDFGLAKAQQLESDLTGSREIFGTPYYMSPEQGHAEHVDARSDLYSLGVMFYEMLIGKKPYLGTSAMEVIYKHKKSDLPAIPEQFKPYAPILQRMLAKLPADRYQSAEQVLESIDALSAPALV